VVCEKPPDVTVEAVDRMIAAQRETGKKLMVIFQSRFEPLYRRMRETIQEGRLGRIVGLHGAVNWWRAQSYFNCPGMWKGTWKWDGGRLAGEPGGAYGRRAAVARRAGGGRCTPGFGCFAHDIETEDKTVAVLTFASGALGTLTTTTAAYPGLDRTIFVHGSNGSIVAEDDLLVRWALRNDDPEAEKEEERRMLASFGKKGDRDVTTASDPFAFATRGHMAQFEAMVEAIRGDTDPPNSIETTRHTVEILNAVYESGRSGQPVRLGTA
jgi:predicted dehydrogenase